MERFNRPKYQHAPPPQPEVEDFDFDSRKCRPAYYKLKDTENMPFNRSREIMMESLQIFCLSCKMCPLGQKMLHEHGQKIDPHVFSNMRSDSRFMMVGQNPGYNECLKGEPFVGQAGQNFDKEIAKNGLERFEFYISNLMKCHTPNNEFDSRHDKYKKTCSAILKLEIQVMKPKLIITLGAPAFNFFAPDKKMSDHLGDIVLSEWGPIFPIYHPSPMNLSDASRAQKFSSDIALMCRLVRKLREGVIETENEIE